MRNAVTRIRLTNTQMNQQAERLFQKILWVVIFIR